MASPGTPFSRALREFIIALPKERTFHVHNLAPIISAHGSTQNCAQVHLTRYADKGYIKRVGEVPNPVKGRKPSARYKVISFPESE
jgi:hypothetical protein